jgi:hypothetical protein
MTLRHQRQAGNSSQCDSPCTPHEAIATVGSLALAGPLDFLRPIRSPARSSLDLGRSGTIALTNPTCGARSWDVAIGHSPIAHSIPACHDLAPPGPLFAGRETSSRGHLSSKPDCRGSRRGACPLAPASGNRDDCTGMAQSSSVIDQVVVATLCVDFAARPTSPVRPRAPVQRQRRLVHPASLSRGERGLHRNRVPVTNPETYSR